MKTIFFNSNTIIEVGEENLKALIKFSWVVHRAAVMNSYMNGYTWQIA